MPMKEWLYRLQPVQLYVVLALSVCYFLVQLLLSHITHALTLLVDSYHMLCNIIALSGCILTIKHSNEHTKRTIKSDEKPKEESCFVEICADQKHHAAHQRHELKLKNTFGWTRIDILTMLIVCVFLASLLFSSLVEALQTLTHIDHQDTMHLPIPVLCLGVVGLFLNGLCYLLIGGYTLHQSSFLHMTSDGDVVLDCIVTGDALKAGERRLSKSKKEPKKHINGVQSNGNRESLVEVFRDICSTLFVIGCSIIVYFADDEQVSKYVDPCISICSCTILLVMSYPYMKESCLILLQTIPGSIDIKIFQEKLLSEFTEVINVHDLHIWQLTASKYVSTVHMIFQNPNVYIQVMDNIVKFFHAQGIANVTIQPEFIKGNKSFICDKYCLVSCQDKSCVEKHCCIRSALPHQTELSNQSEEKVTVPSRAENSLKSSTKFKSTNNLCFDQLKTELKRCTSCPHIYQNKKSNGSINNQQKQLKIIQ